MFRDQMPLSSDPEKRARSLANLKKGGAAAAKKFELPIVGYEEPNPAPSTKAPKAKPAAAPNPAAGEPSPAAPAGTGGPSMLLVLGGGLALLVVLVLILNHTGSRPNA